MKKILLLIISIVSVLIATITSAIIFYNTTVTEDGNHQVITIAPQESIVFSLAKIIDSIEFNKDSGFTIRTLEGGVWIDMSNDPADYTPMKGYIIRNNNSDNLIIDIYSKNITDSNETLFQHTLKAGWNLVGPAYKNDEYKMVNIFDFLGNSNYSHVADFTGEGLMKEYKKDTYTGEVKIYKKQTYSGEVTIKYNTGINHLNKGNTQIKNSIELTDMRTFEGLAYGVFVSNDTIIPGSQDLSEIEDINKKDIHVMSYISSDSDKFSENKNSAEITVNVTGLKSNDEVKVVGFELYGEINEINNYNDGLIINFEKDGNLIKLKDSLVVNNGSKIQFITTLDKNVSINKVYYSVYKYENRESEAREIEDYIDLGTYSLGCDTFKQLLGTCICTEEEISSGQCDDQTSTGTTNTGSIGYQNIKLLDKEIILNDGVEVILDKQSLTITGSNQELSNYKLILSNNNSLSNSANLLDIITESTLNIGGEIFTGYFNENSIEFYPSKKLYLDTEYDLLVTATLKLSDKIVNGDILSLEEEDQVLISGLFGDSDTGDKIIFTVEENELLSNITFNSNTITPTRIILENSELNKTNEEIELFNSTIDISDGKGITLNGFSINRDIDTNLIDIIKNVTLYTNNPLFEESYTGTVLSNQIVFNTLNVSIPGNTNGLELTVKAELYSNGIPEDTLIDFEGEILFNFDKGTLNAVDFNTTEQVTEDRIINNSSTRSIIIKEICDEVTHNDGYCRYPAETYIDVMEFFGIANEKSKIKFIIEKGANTFDNDIILTKLSISNIIEIRDNDDNLYNSGTIINDGDIFTIITGTGSLGTEIQIEKAKVGFSINGIEYTIENTDNISLGTYTE